MCKRRLIAGCVAVCLSLAVCTSFFVASADEIESWVVVNIRFSNDGTNWSGKSTYMLAEGATIQQPNYKYAKIDSIQVLNTTNKPSDLFICFTIAGGGIAGSGQSNTVSLESEYSISNGTQFTGYFRSKSAGKLYNDDGFNFSLGMFVGQYHITDVSDTAFTLTPNNSVYWQSSTSGIYLRIHSVAICFVGNDSQLYELNDWASQAVQWLNDTYDFLEDEIDPALDSINYLVSNFYSLWYNTFLPHFNRLWEIMGNTSYNYLDVVSFGGSEVRRYTTNSFEAMISMLNDILDSVYFPNQAIWVTDFVSYDEDGIGIVETEEDVNWFYAVLNQLRSSSAIEQHHMELENEALENGGADARDSYDSSSSFGFLAGIANISVLNNLSSFREFSDTYGDITSMWFSQEVKDSIMGTGLRGLPEPEVIDFLNSDDLDWYGDH